MSPNPAKISSTPSVLFQINEAKSQMTPAQRMLFVTIVVGLATLAIGIVFIQLPWQKKRQQISNQYNEEKERHELLLAIQRQKADLDGIESKFLINGGTTALTGQISNIARQISLQVDSIVPRPELSVDPYTQFEIEVTATSTLANILKFLRTIEDHRPLFWVEQMEIGEPPTESVPTLLSAYQQQQQGETLFKPADRQKARFLICAVSRQKAS